MTDVKAEHGEKMIEVKLRFWTNELASEEGMIRPKHAWDFGMVRIDSNAAHGIKADKNPRPFNSFNDIASVVEDVLVEYGVTLHHGRKSRKLFAEED